MEDVFVESLDELQRGMVLRAVLPVEVSVIGRGWAEFGGVDENEALLEEEYVEAVLIAPQRVRIRKCDLGNFMLAGNVWVLDLDSLS